MPPVKRPKTKRKRTFLREWREHRELTQNQAAEPLGVDQSTLSRIERGITPYDQDFLERAALLYRCEVDQLLSRNPLEEDAVWSITDNLRKADPADQARAAAVLDAMLRNAG